ncbi:MAG TPA: aminopeptidase P family protein [Candidatus Anaerobutyricum stercoripullorum]|uniref:Aminopeptidase P family protein n=1 Tax=Candidatus Anaerobutyricum stercoripullorum TaxID=2838456 RepID=A0A9D1X429_9FIRM|nr:aminopeptidase P family protein [Candidatus Anaerobutyricum stercoripullorum]
MREELCCLRERMQKESVNAYLIMTDDFHGSEYVGDYFKSREYISGFTGSAGTLLVRKDCAGLWTDGRYFLQAETQLAGSGITLFRSGQPGVPDLEDYLVEQLADGQTLGFDGRCVMAGYARKLRERLEQKGVRIRNDLDLVGDVWPDRPALSKEPVWPLAERYAGIGVKDKLAEVRQILHKKKADWFLLASLEDICWLLNVRGNDVACTPVVLSYLMMGRDQVFWYVQREAVPEPVQTDLQEAGVVLREYGQIYEDVSRLPGGVRLLCDENHVNDALISRIAPDVVVLDGENPTLLLKAVKNPVEVANEKAAHIKDGIAVTRFIYWLKTRVGREEITEMSAAARLEMFRREQEDYLEPSFYPILAYGPHGAIVHYSADETSDVLLEPEGFLLADTGGHYMEGTTDITRTIALGPLTEEQKEMYTTVLKAHIRLADAVFLQGAAGVSLDVLARTPLWERGLDYNHGTGHGVGYLLSVHEGPNSFRFRPSAVRGGDHVMKEGMITSDEPGIYLEGKFGVRLENLLVCAAKQTNSYGTFLGFEPLTMVPFDRDAILWDALSEKELRWLAAYHQKVYESLAPHLSEEERQWLRETTEIPDRR